MNTRMLNVNASTGSKVARHRRWAAVTAIVLAGVSATGSVARAAGTEEDPPTTTEKVTTTGPAGSVTTKPSDSAGSHYEAAKALIAKSSWAEAIAELEQADKMQPNNADVNNLLGYASRKLGRLDVSLSYYQKALKINPKHLGANEYLGELYLMMNQLPKAKVQLATLSKLCGTGCEQYLDLKKAIAGYKAPATKTTTTKTTTTKNTTKKAR